MRAAVVGGWHVHTMEYAAALQKNPGAELVCLWDDDKARGAELAGKLGVPFVADVESIWADPSIDGIQVTSATGQHRDLMVAAARAGKHIFTEKVLAFTVAEAEEIARAVRDSGVKFTISYPHKTQPALKAVKALADSGKLGQITYARVRDAHNGASGGWLPPYFFDEKQTGGGAMIDLGAHPMYTLHWLLGDPVSVVSQFTRVTGKDVEDNAVSVLEYADGAIGVSETGFVSVGNPYLLEVSGTKGSLLVHNGQLEYTLEERGPDPAVQLQLPPADPMPIDAWIAAVNGEGEAPNGIDEAVALTRLMAAAYESARTGRKVAF